MVTTANPAEENFRWWLGLQPFFSIPAELTAAVAYGNNLSEDLKLQFAIFKPNLFFLWASYELALFYTYICEINTLVVIYIRS